MIARKLVQALVFLHYAAGSGATVLTPPDIPMQPLIRTIYEWGDQIAVIAHRLLPAERRLSSELYVVDQAAARIVPARAPECDTYHDVAFDPGRVVLRTEHIANDLVIRWAKKRADFIRRHRLAEHW